jgi:hypothetical protein
LKSGNDEITRKNGVWMMKCWEPECCWSDGMSRIGVLKMKRATNWSGELTDRTWMIIATWIPAEIKKWSDYP